MEHISETKKSDVTMKGKCFNPNTNDSLTVLIAKSLGLSPEEIEHL